MNVVAWQRVEGGLVLASGLSAAVTMGLLGSGEQWWLYLIVFFAPDIGILFYLAGPRPGAAVYNLLHLYGLGLALTVLGWVVLDDPVCTGIGLLFMAHVGFDRMLGYGLKHPSGFADTHLGPIGRRDSSP
jgi:Domain of unknown function (DUF4260)